MNRRAFVLGAVMLLLGSLVAVALRSFAEATFLGAYGPSQMPWLLIATAMGFAVATLGYDALTRLANPRAVDLGLLVGLGTLAGLAPTLLDAGVSPAILVVGLTAASQVAGLALWNRAAAAVAGRDARRMLPRAGAAVTAGGAIAGLGAGVLIPRLGLASIPYIGALVTVVVIVVGIAQERALATNAPGGVLAAVPAARPTLSSVQRGLLAAMITVAVLEGIVTTVIDLQFIATVKGRYTGDTVAIALALFYGGTNAILLVLQVAAVPRLLVTRSLPFTAAIHPALVILSYAGFAIAPGFVGIAGTRTADQVLRLATSRTSQELAFSALPPAPRARWKVLLRGIAWPAGAAAAASVLLAVGPRALREPATLALAAIAIAIVWGIAARVAARRFQAALAAPLGIRETRHEDPRRIDLETLERWTHAAGAGDARSAALARATLARARIDATDLADHLRHDDPEMRAAMFDQLARAPVAALRGELRAAIAIEDDDRALALGIKALTLAGDDTGIARGTAGLSRDVDDTVRTARVMLAKPDPDVLRAELAVLLARDPAWATAMIRAHRSSLTDDDLDMLLRAGVRSPETRSGAFAVLVQVGPARTLPELAAALEAGDADALAALEELDAIGAAALAAALATWSPLARATLARTLAGAPNGVPLISQLVDDRDPEVAYAALRTALAVARGGRVLPANRIAAAHDAALAALAAHLDVRDAIAGTTGSTCARNELEIATRRCVARVLWASAVEAAAAGRDPAPVAATARHLIGGGDADRRRALDVVQELETRPELLAVIERWLQPASHDASTTAFAALAPFDPWLHQLGAGDFAAREPTLVTLRRPALFASIAGPALAALADSTSRRTITGDLFRAGDPGDAMFVVTSGTLVASRPGTPDRRIEAGSVVGELAVLTHAPRAATVSAAAASTEVLVIDRAAFATAARRAPELVLGLSATLAGWLAPNRPDVL